MPQTLRPTADISVGDWTTESGATTNLFASIDEAAASTADYIQSSNNPSNDVVRVKLDSSVVDPLTSFGYSYDYIIGKSGTVQIDMTVRLIEGVSTVIAEWIHTDIPASPTTFSQTLTAPQADAITDHTDLSLEFVANAVSGGSSSGSLRGGIQYSLWWVNHGD